MTTFSIKSEDNERNTASFGTHLPIEARDISDLTLVTKIGEKFKIYEHLNGLRIEYAPWGTRDRQVFHIAEGKIERIQEV